MIPPPIVTFVLVDRYDSDMVEDFKKLKNLYPSGHVAYFTDVETFASVLEGRNAEYQFRLIIHENLTGDNKYSQGQLLGDELRQKYIGAQSVRLVFITRSFEKFPNQEEYLTNENAIYINFNTGFRPSLKNIVPVYSIGQFTGELPATANSANPKNAAQLSLSSTPSSNDFGIITALFDDENAAFRDKCKREHFKNVQNGYSATFKENIKLTTGVDYDKPFLLVHQEKMGLVDAALHSAQVVAEYNPDFLVMAGVCGGNRKKVNQYDIIIPTSVHDYATGKLVDGVIEPKEYKTYANTSLIEFLKREKTKIILNMRSILTHLDSARSGLMSKDFEIHFGDFAAGPWVIKTDGFLENLLVEEVHKDMKGLEMESYSVIRAREILRGNGKFSLVVKSVMDFTGKNKNDGSFGEIKQGASFMSYLCVRAMMPILLEFRENSYYWNKN